MTFDMFQEYIEEHILEGWKRIRCCYGNEE